MLIRPTFLEYDLLNDFTQVFKTRVNIDKIKKIIPEYEKIFTD